MLLFYCTEFVWVKELKSEIMIQKMHATQEC